MSPRKKRKVSELDPEFVADLNAELSLEISLRERLATTLESRITWALMLQEALEGKETTSLQANSEQTPFEFRNAALDALETIDSPCDIIYNRESSLDNAMSCPSPLPPPLPHKVRPPPSQKYTRTKPNPKFLYIKSSQPLSGLASQEPISHVIPPQYVYILTCPICLRTTFSSLQGLLNHSRISHKQEYGGHDECIRACAVPFARSVIAANNPEANADSDKGPDLSLLDGGIEVGGGAGGMGVLPGLRSLFEIAVGDQSHALPLPPTDPSHIHTGGFASETATHLGRTLGLHKDTPALAPFLGKESKRRGVHVWDEDSMVDIDGFDRDETLDRVIESLGVENAESRSDNILITSQDIEMGDLFGHKSGAQLQPKPKRPWRMPFTHRNIARPELDLVLTDDDVTSHTTIIETTASIPPPTVVPGSTMKSGIGSRFHITARIVVADRSFWIPIEKRRAPNEDHTHKWMISVDSPSYTHHITTFLTRLSVASLTHAEPNSFTALPLSTSKPPFVIVGTTDRPFLASIELLFTDVPSLNGEESRKQKMILEHWVELDPMQSLKPVLGDENVVDVELDRSTVFLPIKTDYTPIGARALWDIDGQGTTMVTQVNDTRDMARDDEPGYAQILRSLLPRFPMTHKDIKGRPPTSTSTHAHHPQLNLPYKLVTTPAHFKSLVPGRRKAIEWARARAIREAYSEIISSGPPNSFEGMIPLTTADVFSWLDEAGHFPRSRVLPVPDAVESKLKAKIVTKTDPQWCSTCGIALSAHLTHANVGSMVKKETLIGLIKHEEMEYGADYVCPVAETNQMNKIPIININHLSNPQYPLEPQIPDSLVRQPTVRNDSVTQSKSWNHRHLIAVCDPNLTIVVKHIVEELKLSSFSSHSPFSLVDSQPIFPTTSLGTSASQVESHLAPHAVLSLLTQTFVRALVKGGMEIAKQDKDILQNSTRKKKIGPRVLTPSHVLRGISSSPKFNIFKCLSRLGIPLDMNGAAERLPSDLKNTLPSWDTYPEVEPELPGSKTTVVVKTEDILQTFD